MEVIYLTMADLSKSSPAREHFVGLGNGLVKMCRVAASFPLIGEKVNQCSDLDFKTSPFRVPLSFKNRFSRLFALCLFNVFVPFFVVKKLMSKTKGRKVIYSRHMPADIINLMIAKIFGVKFCVEINGDVSTDRSMEGKNKLITYFMAKLQRYVIDKSDYIIVPTANLKRNLSEKYNVNNEKVVYIENGIEIDKFIQSSTTNYLPHSLKNKFIFGYAGIFSQWQGIHLIVESISYLNDELLSNSMFVLAGDGPEFDKIKKLVQELGLEKFFYFTGFLEQKKYISVVKQFDVCLAPYIKDRNDYWGVSPIKIHSYMACSKPIITSDISGARELITDSQCGYLFEPDNAKSLAHYLSYAFDERHLLGELGGNGFKSVSRNCTWDALAEKLYEKIKW